jgi:hypothetical protein
LLLLNLGEMQGHDVRNVLLQLLLNRASNRRDAPARRVIHPVEHASKRLVHAGPHALQCTRYLLRAFPSLRLRSTLHA